MTPPELEVRPCPEGASDLVVHRGQMRDGHWSHPPAWTREVRVYTLAVALLTCAGYAAGDFFHASTSLVLTAIGLVVLAGRRPPLPGARQEQVTIEEGILHHRRGRAHVAFPLASILSVRVRSSSAGLHLEVVGLGEATHLTMRIGRRMHLAAAPLVWLAAHIKDAALRVAPEVAP